MYYPAIAVYHILDRLYFNRCYRIIYNNETLLNIIIDILGYRVIDK